MRSHTFACNVIRQTCKKCKLYFAYCVTHQQVTEYNRCTCPP